nr:hypothetical protein [Deinococcus psychrotolerans]
MSFPGVNQAFVDAVLPSCLSHIELTAEDSEHDLLFGVGRPLLSLFSHDFPPVCPTLASGRTFLEGFPKALPDDTQRARQRYRCLNCTKKFDDLTSTVFAGHHQPLQLWVACLYLMGLNVSNRQIAQELGLNVDDVQDMTRTLQRGVVDVSTTPTLAGTVEIDEIYIVAGHKGQPQEVEKGAHWTKTTSERQAWAWHCRFRQAAGPGHHRAWRSVDLASV